MMTMTKSIAVAAIVLSGTLSLGVTVADRVMERASQDRLTFGDPSANEPLAR